ncbi:uncharacterized protein LOC116158578 isoform X2 [Photinus pyralis]|nr:uncharacterized protein LOC116158578 isoform X2 [Photinus pyralis]
MNGDTYIVNTGSASGVYVPSVSQGLPTLIVMVVVLVIIVLFCFWGAPAIRAFCRKRICCCCAMDEPSIDNVSTAGESATPTIILLPYGRMLVVDRNVFRQLQADRTGIDFIELSANLILQDQNGSHADTLESEDTSKGLSLVSLDFLPPPYDDIFGLKNSDLPPSYSEISVMLQKLNGKPLDSEQLHKSELSVIMVKPKECILRTSSDPFILTDKMYHTNTRMRRDFVSLGDNIVQCEASIQEEINVFEGASGCNYPSYKTNINPINRTNIQDTEYFDRESSV